ncbi:MAG: toxin VasX [Thiohalomonadales bacterium]
MADVAHTAVPANSTKNKDGKKRHILFDRIKNTNTRKLNLRYNDTVHGWCNIPFGNVTPEKKDSITKNQHLFVPILPLLFSTPERNKDQYREIDQGWLYIFRNEFLWRELEVVKNGQMRDVNLRYSQGLDERQASSELDTRVIVPHQVAGVEQNIEMAFSEVQWSWSQIITMGGMNQNDPRYRENLHNGKAHGLDHSATSKDIDFYRKRVDKIILSNHSNNFETEITPSAHVAHVTNPKNLTLTKTTPPKIKLQNTSEIAAVILNDPIGITHQLTAELAAHWNELMATMASLETGIKPGSRQVVIPYEAEDIKAQFNIATYMYQIGFGNDKNKEQYGDDLSKNRLEAILGVKERKLIRDKIKIARDALIKQLKVDEYQKAMTDYTRNIHSRLIDGKAIIALHNEHVATHPHEKDFHFDIPDNIEPDLHQEDAGWEYLRDTLLAKNDIGAMLYATVDKQKIAILGKADAIITKLLEGFKKLIVKDVLLLKHSVLIINSFKANGVPEVEVKQMDLRPQIPKGYRTVPGAIRTEIVEEIGVEKTTTVTDTAAAKKAFDGTGQKSASGVAKVEFGEAKIQIYPAGTDITAEAKKFDVSSTTTKTVHLIVEKKHPTNRLLKGIEHTEMYRYGVKGVLGIVELINLGSAINEMKTKGLTGRELLNVTGSIAGSLNFALEMRTLHLDAVGENLGRKLTKLMKLSGRVSPALGFVVSSYDSFNRFNVEDYDAAAWHGAAAASGLVLMLIAASGLILLPIGLIVFGLFAAIMGSMAEDDLIETYAKHGHFRKQIDTIDGTDLWAKIKIQASNPVYSEDFKKWKDLKVAEDELTNLLHGLKIAMGAKYDLDDNVVVANGMKTTITKATVIKARVTFKRFELVSSRLDYRMRIYPNGLDALYKNNKKYIEIRPNALDYINEDELGGIKGIKMQFNLAANVTNTMNEKSEIIFICRQLMNISTGNFVPTTDAGGEFRYYAVRRKGTKGYHYNTAYGGAVEETSASQKLDGKHRVIGTIMQIENSHFWNT